MVVVLVTTVGPTACAARDRYAATRSLTDPPPPRTPRPRWSAWMRAAAASRPIPLSLCRPGLLRSGGADRLDGVRRVFFLEPFPSYLAALVTPHGLHLPYTHRSTGAAGAGALLMADQTMAIWDCRFQVFLL